MDGCTHSCVAVFKEKKKVDHRSDSMTSLFLILIIVTVCFRPNRIQAAIIHMAGLHQYNKHVNKNNQPNTKIYVKLLEKQTPALLRWSVFSLWVEENDWRTRLFRVVYRHLVSKFWLTHTDTHTHSRAILLSQERQRGIKKRQKDMIAFFVSFVF